MKFLALLLLPSTALAGGLTVDVTGSCPGPATVTITGITPGATVGILRGSGPGRDVIPGGPCAGVPSMLSGLGLVTTARDADRDGVAVLSPTLPGGACAATVQVVDLESCATSNIEPISGGGDHVFEESFTNGVTAVAQCTAWDDWRADLPLGGVRAVRVSGTFDEEGLSCSDPAVAQGLADALRDGTTFEASCDGHVWSLCDRYSGELWIDPPALCDGSNCPSPGHLVRPCIGNANWGGVNTATCSSQPDQVMRVEFL